MREFNYRTEDIKPDAILEMYVGTQRDNELVAGLKSTNPLILEGSRGTGKSFLLRVAEQQQLTQIEANRVLPVYVSFQKSSLLHANNPLQFQSWMLARICSRILRVLSSQGYAVATPAVVNILAGGSVPDPGGRTRLEMISDEYENSYKHPGETVNDAGVPHIEMLQDAVQDLCDEVGLNRINLMFDEAAHIFRPEQQRQFFTLFRDLRSSYITCNAAVYPGVTSYGESFQAMHDARIESLNRSITSADYLGHMREMILKQADSDLHRDIERQGANFDALAFAVSGNPRLLLKTIALVPGLRASETQRVLKEFYRSGIWEEHTGLSERYVGHRELIDWGREFIERVVIPDTLGKNRLWLAEGKMERTCIFWVSRDAPQAAKEALRLLMYTGIVTRMDSGVVATRGEYGTRYAINVGCLAASEANPVDFITDLRRGLTVKRFTEYGANFRSFVELSSKVGPIVEFDMSAGIAAQLGKSINVLDLTEYQKSALANIGIAKIGEALGSTEDQFQAAPWIGPKRSRRIMNIVVAAVLEYLSG